MTVPNGYLCSHCRVGSVHYEDWLLDITRRAVRSGSLSHPLWAMRHCDAGHPFAGLFDSPGAGSYNTAPYVVELIALEAADVVRTAHEFGADDVTPISLETGLRPKRSGMYLDALSWMGLAVASGVLGNLAYDGIKAAVRRFRERNGGPTPLDGLDDAEVERRLLIMYAYVSYRLADVRVEKLDADDGTS